MDATQPMLTARKPDSVLYLTRLELLQATIAPLTL